jgi:hypothetical protein
MSGQSWVSAAYQTALLAYAVGRAAFFQTYMRSPAPSNATRTVQGVYGSTFELDPNVNAKNNTAVNGGNAYKGVYDASQTYHTVHNSYFGAPLRFETAYFDGGTIWIANLNYQLYKRTGQAAYLTEFNSICAAFLDFNGFGRPYEGTQSFGSTLSNLIDQGAGTAFNGVRCFGNFGDPWTDGQDYGRFMRNVRDADAAGLGNYMPMKQAFCATARNILAASSDQYLTADWSGPEYEFLDKTNSWTQAHTEGAGGNYNVPGSAFGNPRQAMTTGCALIVVSAAAQLAIANDPAVITSGLGAMPIEALAADVAALHAALESKAGISGGLTFPNFIGWGNKKSRLDGDDIGYPCVFFNDYQGYLRYDITNNYLAFWQQPAGGVRTERFRLSAAGALIQGDATTAGTHYVGQTLYAQSGVVAMSTATGSQLYMGNPGGFPGIALGSAGYFINSSSGHISFVAGNSEALRVQSGNVFVYGAMNASYHYLFTSDNVYNFASSSQCAAGIYLGNQPNVRSDMRLKTQVTPYSADEIACAREVGKLLTKYKYIAAVEEKGDKARWQSGALAQLIVQKMQDHGLVNAPAAGGVATSIPYTFVGYDIWEARLGEPAVEAVDEVSHIEEGPDGQSILVVDTPAVPARPAIPAVEAGYVYTVRYEALLVWIAAAHEQAITSIEARLAKLEAA